jgi:hypothetical protein
MSALNQFLNGLNQNRSLHARSYPVEGNRVFGPVICGQGRPFARNLNRFVNGFHESARGVMMIADRA